MTRNEDDHGKPRLPLEVCESVIDRVYHPSLFDHRVNRHCQGALSQCALVCRGWRTRAQMRLFYCVELRTTYLLHVFVELLHQSPSLATHVHVVLIHGSSHYTPADSVFPLFPTVLAGKLPNLRDMSVYGTGIDGRPGSPCRRGERVGARRIKLPHLPLHPWFPVLLNDLRQLTTLRLGVLTFPSFGDFARILHRLSRLQSLVCDGVDWSTLGLVPPCIKRGWFLPELATLKVRVQSLSSFIHVSYSERSGHMDGRVWGRKAICRVRNISYAPRHTCAVLSTASHGEP